MSFKHNDNNNHMIHLGNYEEFFVLYIDNELSDEQMKMVDDFLVSHPDLQAEFEILATTKLPVEDFTINKSELMADSMKLNAIDEELLLYIDNELTAEQKKIVDLELASNQDYRLQHQLLLKTKLDAAEKIYYPNKKELYRRTGSRVIAMKTWMRAAVAVVLVASMGVLYWNGNNNNEGPAATGPVASSQQKQPVQTSKQESKNLQNKEEQKPGNEILEDNNQDNELILASAKKEKSTPVETKQEDIINPSNEGQELIARNEVERIRPEQRPVQALDINQPSFTMGNLDITRENTLLNNLAVTSGEDGTYNHTNAATQNNVVAGNNESKGSVKGFLRRATRLIEKRTGIDPTSDGELLIGVVAVKLK